MSRNGARPKRVPKFPKTGNPEQSKVAKALDDLAEFEDFRETLLPAIRKDLKKGLTAQQIQAKYAAYAQARLVQIALMETDSGKASAAAKDILDRTHGRATEKKEVTHRFKDLTDAELDAVLQSEEADLDSMEDRFDS